MVIGNAKVGLHVLKKRVLHNGLLLTSKLLCCCCKVPGGLVVLSAHAPSTYNRFGYNKMVYKPGIPRK